MRDPTLGENGQNVSRTTQGSRELDLHILPIDIGRMFDGATSGVTPPPVEVIRGMLPAASDFS